MAAVRSTTLFFVAGASRRTPPPDQQRRRWRASCDHDSLGEGAASGLVGLCGRGGSPRPGSPAAAAQEVYYMLNVDILDELVKGDITTKAIEQVDFRDERCGWREAGGAPASP